MPSAAAAAFLVRHLQITDDRDELFRAVQHVARYGKAEERARLLKFVRTFKPDNTGVQVRFFHAIERGTQERGASV